MIKRKIISVIFWGLLLSLVVSCRSNEKKIYLIPTLHNLHAFNAQYSYDSLRQIIKKLNPDIIAVEIRPEDLERDSSYLKKNYPYEMWMMKYWFADKKIVGIDWLGEDIEGQAIPSDYWQKRSFLKKLEKALDKDSLFVLKMARCSEYMVKRMKILQNSSLRQILQSQDADLTKKYYQCLAQQLDGSKYEKLLTFYRKRDKKLFTNIQHTVARYPKKTIVVLCGDDHYAFLKDQITHSPFF